MAGAPPGKTQAAKTDLPPGPRKRSAIATTSIPPWFDRAVLPRDRADVADDLREIALVYPLASMICATAAPPGPRRTRAVLTTCLTSSSACAAIARPRL